MFNFHAVPPLGKSASPSLYLTTERILQPWHQWYERGLELRLHVMQPRSCLIDFLPQNLTIFCGPTVNEHLSTLHASNHGPDLYP